MSKIRVMHIVQPKGGGVERYTEMLLKYFDKEKYRNIFVCSKDYCSEDYTDFASSVLKVPMKRSIGIHDIKSILRVRKIIKRYKPDIVYMHSSKAGAIGRIANMGIKNYSIYNPHGWSFDMKVSKIKRNFYIYIERFLSRFTDKIVAISDYEKRIALENKIGSEDKIKVILNGIDFERYYNDCTLPPIEKEKLGIPKDSYVIGTLGRISKQKAPDTFIAAAALIKFKIPNAHFIMVGDGDEREEIEDLISISTLAGSVTITGDVPDTYRYMGLFDQAMLLSKWEGFGLVLPEYMVCKKPIIATNVSAIPEIIKDGYNGVLVPVDDVKSIVNASLKLYSDKAFAEQIAENGHKDVVEKFSIERVIREHENLFDELLCKNL